MRMLIISFLKKALGVSDALEKLDALTQSGFVYTSYTAATADMELHVSGYVASC